MMSFEDEKKDYAYSETPVASPFGKIPIEQRLDLLIFLTHC